MEKRAMLDYLEQETVRQFSEQFAMKEIPRDAYSKMRWPKLLPLMKFDVTRYQVDGFGHLMLMRTRATGGMMQLCTVSMTPSEGLSVPYLLIDCMTMKQKRTVFVEFYDCTRDGVKDQAFDLLTARYAGIPDYSEKPAWYISERMPCSLIKGVEDGKEDRLKQMLSDSVRAYLSACDRAEKNEENLKGLKAFQERMIQDGNPSSSTMEKVLKKDGAEHFFRTVVMPV